MGCDSINWPEAASAIAGLAFLAFIAYLASKD